MRFLLKELSIWGFLGVEGFEKGLKNITMHIDVEDSKHCANIYNGVKEVLNRWIAGSTIKRTGILDIETKTRYLEH